MFKIKGRADDVAAAKEEILAHSDHFTKIRASKRNGALNGRPDDVTIPVGVPVDLVGLVVGSKGATIKEIQQRTDTYIVTPSREKDAVFEVKGLPKNVLQAKKLIYEHICKRTEIEMGDLLRECSLQHDYENPFGFASNPWLHLQLLLNQSNWTATNSANDALTSSGALMPAPASTGVFYGDHQFGCSYESDEGFIGSPRDQPTTPENTPPSVWSASECPMMPKKVKVNSPMQRRPTDFGANNSASLGCYSDMTSPMFGFDCEMGGAGSQQQQQFDTLSHRSSAMTTLTSGGASVRSSPLSSADSSPIFSHGPASLPLCVVCQGPPARRLACSHGFLCHACALQCASGDVDCKCRVCHARVA